MNSETLGLLPDWGTSGPVLPVPMVTSPGVLGREGSAISAVIISPSSPSECSEDEADPE